jgi:hypothetical protein
MNKQVLTIFGIILLVNAALITSLVISAGHIIALNDDDRPPGVEGTDETVPDPDLSDDLPLQDTNNMNPQLDSNTTDSNSNATNMSANLDINSTN